jgi:hypothetical protein
MSLIEATVLHRRHGASQSVQHGSNEFFTSYPKKENADAEIHSKDTVPGMLGSPGHGGLYAGPTSAATHLLSVSVIYTIVYFPSSL